MERTVVAEKVFSQYKNTEVWKVAVQVPSGKKYAFKDIVEPLKAMRYMMMLKAKQHATINQENFDAVREAYNAAKAEAKNEEPKAQNQEEKPKRKSNGKAKSNAKKEVA